MHEKAHTNVCFIYCDRHKLYDFKEHGVDLKVEGVHYIEMHRRYNTYIGTLNCVLENGVYLYVNERQKIRHYRAKSTEERREERR